MVYYGKIIKSLQEIQNMNSYYSLSNESLEATLQEIHDAKVCIPIIGKFSSGKSALLNTVLGYSKNKKILKEDITPETAVPTEIIYGDIEDEFYVVANDGTYKQLTSEEYRNTEVDADSVERTRIILKNSFLEQIPDLMLVDMPGFESGYEVHNRAIDNYVSRSLVYIIAFPADDMVVRTSVGNTLKELCLHDMPICVVITKYDKSNDEFDATFTALKESIKRFIGNREVCYCKTSSFTSDAEELKEFLIKVQEESQIILANKFRNNVLSAADTTENYLTALLKNSEMSESELVEQENRLNSQLDEMNDKFVKEKENFDNAIVDCISEIKADVQVELSAHESEFVAMLMNKQDINERVNLVVRSAVTTSLQKRFVAKLDKYIKKVADCINKDTVENIRVSFNFDVGEISKNIVSIALKAVAAIIICGPILGPIIALILAWFSKSSAEKKREEAKNQIRQKLYELYPRVLSEVGRAVEIAVIKQVNLINETIETEIEHQRNVLQQAIDDLRKKKAEETERKNDLMGNINNDLARLAEIRSEI